jgi:Cu/Ag efflux protein CusF
MKSHQLAISTFALVAAVAQAALPDVDAEVRKIDTAKNAITLKHKDIPNLGMSGMTMMFDVADPKLLKGVKEGDKVKFQVDMVAGKPTVMSLRVVK